MRNEFRMMYEAATHCTYCRRPFGPTLKKTKDHVLPLEFEAFFPRTFAERGGVGHRNIVAACGRCNNLRAHFRHSTVRLMEFLGKAPEDLSYEDPDNFDVFSMFTFCKRSLRTLANKTKHLDPENFAECDRIVSKFRNDVSSISPEERRFLVNQRTHVDRIVYEKFLEKKRKSRPPLDEDVFYTKDQLKSVEQSMEQDELYSLLVKAQQMSPEDVPAMAQVLSTYILTGKVSDPDLVMRLDKIK